MSSTDVTIVIHGLASAKALAMAAQRDVRTPRGVKILAGQFLKDVDAATAAARRLEAPVGFFTPRPQTGHSSVVRHGVVEVEMTLTMPGPIVSGDALGVDNAGRLTKARPDQTSLASMIEDWSGGRTVFVDLETGRAANTWEALKR